MTIDIIPANVFIKTLNQDLVQYLFFFKRKHFYNMESAHSPDKVKVFWMLVAIKHREFQQPPCRAGGFVKKLL